MRIVLSQFEFNALGKLHAQLEALKLGTGASVEFRFENAQALSVKKHCPVCLGDGFNIVYGPEEMFLPCDQTLIADVIYHGKKTTFAFIAYLQQWHFVYW